MVAVRSRRLERLFDARLDDVTHTHIADLVTAAVPEAYDCAPIWFRWLALVGV